MLFAASRGTSQLLDFTGSSGIIQPSSFPRPASGFPLQLCINFVKF